MAFISLPQVAFSILVAVSCSGHCMVQALRVRATSNESVSGWDVSKEDEITLQQVIKAMNAAGMDAAWTWKNAEEHEWTFPYVKLTDDDPKVSLALHMLHRHGMAPWVAAMHNDDFEQHHNKRLSAHSGLGEEESVKVFVESQETFGPVMNMKRLLESMSLSALRNLYSFDHDWSVSTGEHDSKQPQCADDFIGDTEGPHMCALQVGFSKRTHALLQKHGMNAEMAANLEEKDGELMSKARKWAFQKLSPHFTHDVTQPRYTGKVSTMQCLLDDAGCVLEGAFYWEDGGQSFASVPVPKKRVSSLYSHNGLDLDKTKVAEYVTEWLTEQSREHFVHIQGRDRRLVRWAAEQAELSQLFVL